MIRALYEKGGFSCPFFFGFWEDSEEDGLESLLSGLSCLSDVSSSEMTVEEDSNLESLSIEEDLGVLTSGDEEDVTVVDVLVSVIW